MCRQQLLEEWGGPEWQGCAGQPGQAPNAGQVLQLLSAPSGGGGSGGGSSSKGLLVLTPGRLLSVAPSQVRGAHGPLHRTVPAGVGADRPAWCPLTHVCPAHACRSHRAQAVSQCDLRGVTAALLLDRLNDSAAAAAHARADSRKRPPELALEGPTHTAALLMLRCVLVSRKPAAPTPPGRRRTWPLETERCKRRCVARAAGACGPWWRRPPLARRTHTSRWPATSCAA
jgi:hypothetical protein